MSRIANTLRLLKKQGKTALVPYVVGGDPFPKGTVALMHALVKGGANIIELGICFSDPVAEGIIIQQAHERALKQDISLIKIFDMVSEFRKIDNDTPIVLMGYANPIEIMGYQKFADKANVAGVDGVLIVDLPPEEGRAFKIILDRHKIDNIYLIAPTTTNERIKLITSLASGYLYYVSLKGVTGAQTLDINLVFKKLELIKSINELPICVGFGIKDPNLVKQISSCAEGVVIGSALVDLIARCNSQETVLLKAESYMQTLRKVMDHIV